ncbi:hypothetical protein GCM10023149_31640 [Mucilaginibacter gynuensis]|uniref:L,D-TPase catalytic domain-containing protein n=1 Tax=Mucilaginibacter gynuensis TaxID=1302236 RepID=A0ABP8GPP1_9SPHI
MQPLFRLNYVRAAVAVLAPLLIFLSVAFKKDKGFLDTQKSNVRVKTAYADKQSLITERLKRLNLDMGNINILITVYKNERQLCIYAKRPDERAYKMLSSYDICALSGSLGPKRKDGDRQVPEGFYYIDRFNPTSAYHLSLGLNFPNAADKIKCGSAKPGGDIFIHGKCLTIGCMPMTDDYIKEIYILAIQARQNGQLKIPVYIFPFKFDGVSAQGSMNTYATNKPMLSFWNNLKTGYTKFNTNHQELKYAVNTAGDYVFQ